MLCPASPAQSTPERRYHCQKPRHPTPPPGDDKEPGPTGHPLATRSDLAVPASSKYVIPATGRHRMHSDEPIADSVLARPKVDLDVKLRRLLSYGRRSIIVSPLSTTLSIPTARQLTDGLGKV
jgi:hypothetical protein